jgi:hypothetical protein
LLRPSAHQLFNIFPQLPIEYASAELFSCDSSIFAVYVLRWDGSHEASSRATVSLRPSARRLKVDTTALRLSLW